MLHILTDFEGKDVAGMHRHDTVDEARACQAEFSRDEDEALSEMAWLQQEQAAFVNAYEYQDKDPRDYIDALGVPA